MVMFGMMLAVMIALRSGGREGGREGEGRGVLKDKSTNSLEASIQNKHSDEKVPDEDVTAQQSCEK
jgi:hypothetical protein